MSGRILTTVGISMPEDFPFEEYEAVHERMRNLRDRNENVWSLYASSWNAVAFRFCSCAEHDDNFTQSVIRFGSAPEPNERYIQERELFGFFVTAMSTIDCFSFGLYAIASMVKGSEFPTSTARELSSIDLCLCRKRFSYWFRNDAITHRLKEILHDKEYKRMYKLRNILAHRLAPSRLHHVSVSLSSIDLKNEDKAFWMNGIKIDPRLTRKRRQWLAGRLDILLKATKLFSEKYLLP